MYGLEAGRGFPADQVQHVLLPIVGEAVEQPLELAAALVLDEGNRLFFWDLDDLVFLFLVVACHHHLVLAEVHTHHEVLPVYVAYSHKLDILIEGALGPRLVALSFRSRFPPARPHRSPDYEGIVRYVFYNFLLLLPRLSQFFGFVLRLALIQPFEQPGILGLDAFELLPAETGVEAAIHPFPVLVFLRGTSINPMRNLLKQVSIFPLDFCKLVLFKHKPLVLVENVRLPFPLVGAGPHVPEPFLVTV